MLLRTVRCVNEGPRATGRTLWGLYTLGFDWEANDFFYFLADVAEADPDDLQIMYDDQSQHDVWGAILDSFYLHTKSRRRSPTSPSSTRSCT